MTAKKLTPRTWYLVGAGLIVSAVTMAVIAYGQMMSKIEGMHRVVMPGRAEVTLPAGQSTLFAEHESVVDGKHFSIDGTFNYRCKFEQHEAAKISQSTGKVKYGLGDYAGRNVFDVDVNPAGTYTLLCESDDNRQFVLAVGRGIGSAIVVMLVGLLPFMGGIAIFVVVAIRRSMQKKSIAAAAGPTLPTERTT